MSTHGARTNLTLRDFTEALRLLDNRLESQIELHVVSGFALLARRLRDKGVTADINTVTADWDEPTVSAIAEVAEELNLPPDWINNDTVFSFGDEVDEDDVSAFDALLEARYEPFDFGTKNVKVSVADIPTLIKSKAYAASDIGLGRTEKDMDDLVSLIQSLGIPDFASAKKALPWLVDPEFSGLAPHLAEAMAARTHTMDEVSIPPSTSDPTIFRNDEEEWPRR